MSREEIGEFSGRVAVEEIEEVCLGGIGRRALNMQMDFKRYYGNIAMAEVKSGIT